MRYPYLRDLENGDVDLEITAQGLCFVNEAGRSAMIDWPEIRMCRAVTLPSASRLHIGKY